MGESDGGGGAENSLRRKRGFVFDRQWEKQKRQQLIISMVLPLSSLFVTETNTAISASEHLNVIEGPTER